MNNETSRFPEALLWDDDDLGPVPPLPLSPAQQAAIDDGLREHGCRFLRDVVARQLIRNDPRC